MIVNKNSALPTKFAVVVATTHGLFVPPEQEPGNEELWFELRDRLANFQKLSLSLQFDDCLVAYYNYDITKDQIECLKFIHTNTKKWLKGQVAENLLNHLSSKTISGRDAKEIAEFLNDNFIDKNPDKKSNTKSMLVKLANLPEGIEISEDDDDIEQVEV